MRCCKHSKRAPTPRRPTWKRPRGRGAATPRNIHVAAAAGPRVADRATPGPRVADDATQARHEFGPKSGTCHEERVVGAYFAGQLGGDDALRRRLKKLNSRKEYGGLVAACEAA